jgi:hypothetical protein
MLHNNMVEVEMASIQICRVGPATTPDLNHTFIFEQFPERNMDCLTQQGMPEAKLGMPEAKLALPEATLGMPEAVQECWR